MKNNYPDTDYKYVEFDSEEEKELNMNRQVLYSSDGIIEQGVLKIKKFYCIEIPSEEVCRQCAFELHCKMKPPKITRERG